MKTSNAYEGKLRAERIRFSGAHFLEGLLESSGDIRPTKKRATRDTFFKNHEPTCVPEISLSL